MEPSLCYFTSLNWDTKSRMEIVKHWIFSNKMTILLHWVYWFFRFSVSLITQNLLILSILYSFYIYLFFLSFFNSNVSSSLHDKNFWDIWKIFFVYLMNWSLYNTILKKSSLTNILPIKKIDFFNNWQY